MKRLPLTMLLAVLCLAQTSVKSGIDRSMLDPTCKPCDDFWRYATGGWADAHPIPADQARWGTFPELRDSNAERLKTILDSFASNPAATGDERRLGDFFAACMDGKAMEAAGMKAIQPPLDQIAGMQSRQDLMVALAILPGASPLGIGSAVDIDDTNRTIARVASGGLSLPERDYYFRDDTRSDAIRREFVEHVQRTLRLLGDSADSASATARSVLEFETALAEITPTSVARRDPSQVNHKMAFAQLQELSPDYDWTAVFAAGRIPTSVAINVESLEFVQAVNRLLAQAPLNTWKGWLRWRTVNGRLQYLSKAYYDEWFDFDQKFLSGIPQQLPRWKVCVSQSDSVLGDVLGRLYVEKHFPAEAQLRMRELVENLRVSLGEQMQASEWLGEQTKVSALRKLATFDPRVGYPATWHNYSAVQVSRARYLESVESAAAEQRAFNSAKIDKPTDKTVWTMTAPTVNANYMARLNAITFPAGILQFPFFDLDADSAVNYGAIGAVIGHEMGHGFDDQGSQSDADGNLKNWWSASDRTKFEERARCVTNQFDSIDVGDGMRHNGKLVTGEAMGDLAGLILAYKAYHRSLQGKEAPVIDGFTGDQRFFLAWARVWSGSQRPDAARRQLATDPHPLAKFRTNATLQNMPEFHQAFACKRGDPMVRPVELQCRLW